MASNGREHIEALLNPSVRVRLVIELICFVLCMLATIFQLAILDFYFVHYTGNNLAYLGWIGGDLLVIAVMSWLLTNAIRYNNRCSRGQCSSDANLRFAYIVWFVYSVVLSAKIAAAIFVYHDKINSKEMFGIQVYRMVLSISSLIFMLLVMSHHYTRLQSPRQVYLHYLLSSITLDLLDSVQFLDLLYRYDGTGHTIAMNDRIAPGIKIAIIVFACINFILPGFALLKLRYKHGFPMRWRACLPYEKMYTLFYLLLVNVPYFVIRLVQWTFGEDEALRDGGPLPSMSIFIVKNVIMTVIGVRELWISWLVHKEKKAEEGDGGSPRDERPHGGVERPECTNGDSSSTKPKHQKPAPSGGLYPSVQE